MHDALAYSKSKYFKTTLLLADRNYQVYQRSQHFKWTQKLAYFTLHDIILTWWQLRLQAGSPNLAIVTSLKRVKDDYTPYTWSSDKY